MIHSLTYKLRHIHIFAHNSTGVKDTKKIHDKQIQTGIQRARFEHTADFLCPLLRLGSAPRTKSRLTLLGSILRHPVAGTFTLVDHVTDTDPYQSWASPTKSTADRSSHLLKKKILDNN